MAQVIQNVTQSREIKFGDFMEDIITKYIKKMGYRNINKSIGTDENGDALSADQVFIKDNTVYLIEQKIRDDHDSTKKRGQYQNFRKKYILLKNKFPDKEINASMWFIDDSLVKNKNYYLSEARNENIDRIKLNVFYGSSIFKELFHNTLVWDELTEYLSVNKTDRTKETLLIPDFDTSPEMLEALKNLKRTKLKLYNKLISDNPTYIQLRKELFPTSYNIDIVKNCKGS